MVNGEVTRRAATMIYPDGFRLLLAIALACLPLVPALRCRSPQNVARPLVKALATRSRRAAQPIHDAP